MASMFRGIFKINSTNRLTTYYMLFFNIDLSRYPHCSHV